ncbi:MAG: hypothetical protein ACI9W6_003120 [Motiliproteus sp.]|jgi:hypothetical protein
MTQNRVIKIKEWGEPMRLDSALGYAIFFQRPPSAGLHQQVKKITEITCGTE